MKASQPKFGARGEGCRHVEGIELLTMREADAMYLLTIQLALVGHFEPRSMPDFRSNDQRDAAVAESVTGRGHPFCGQSGRAPLSPPPLSRNPFSHQNTGANIIVAVPVNLHQYNRHRL